MVKIYSAITADIITGFPQEDEENFWNTFENMKKINFSDFHIFPYSDREKTAAAAFTGKIEPEVKKERVKILEKLKDFDLTGKTVEYVDIEWHEAFKKIHRKTTDSGREVGIRLDDSVLTRGLFQDDVIYADEKLVIAVNTPPCEVIEVSLEPGHEKYVAKVCYEIGNRHAPLFWGDQENTFITIYNEPMMVMLEKLHGVRAEKKTLKLDFDRRISASIHNHHH